MGNATQRKFNRRYIAEKKKQRRKELSRAIRSGKIRLKDGKHYSRSSMRQFLRDLFRKKK